LPYDPAAPVAQRQESDPALERAGCFVERSSGSHHLLVHRLDPRRRVTIAYHGSRDIPRATLAHILRQAQLTADEFVTLL
jgi:predicted RNA binding protein YcfA (HicA-like mRNA interferase family)